MKIHLLTTFPEMFAPLKTSMLARAEQRGILTIQTHNIRDYTRDKHRRTDDSPYGGGTGMVMTCQPIFSTMEALLPKEGEGGCPRKVYMSPKGRRLDESLARELAQEEELMILCGHYEGVDQRVIDYWEMEEISIGDYILTGGEPAAIVLVDAVARLIPGVLPTMEAATEESLYSGLLEHPQYTKPAHYQGQEVPEVLTGGNHREIHLWRWEQSLRLTKQRRPDLFEAFLKGEKVLERLTKEEKKILEKVKEML